MGWGQTIELVDTHTHLNDAKFADDVADTVARARAAGVTRLINMGDTLESSAHAIVLAHAYDGLYAGIGIHPEEARPLTAAAMVIAGGIGPPADAHPHDVVLARVARRIRPGHRAQPVQLAPLGQGVGRVFAHVALLPPPDHAVLKPDLFHRSIHARHALHAVRGERARKARPSLAARDGAHQPPANARILGVVADDVHLDAVDNLLGKVEKLDQYGISDIRNIQQMGEIRFQQEDARALKVYFEDFYGTEEGYTA